MGIQIQMTAVGEKADLLKEIVQKKHVIGLGILEVAPVENDVRTEYGAAQLCYNIISNQVFKNYGIVFFGRGHIGRADK